MSGSARRGDAGQAGHGDLDDALRRGCRDGRRGIEADAVLGGEQPGCLEPGHETQVSPPGLPLDDRIGVVEERGVAPKLVDDEAPGESAFGRRQQRPCADEARDHAAAIHVAYQRHGNLGCQREAHVGDVVLPQVDLGRAAGSFHQDQVGALAEPPKTLQHARHEPGLERVIAARIRRAGDGALHHHLRAVLALGLEQHRVHVDVGLDPGGAGLQRLGAADLAPVARDGGVVGHVLGLEGADRVSTVGERSQKSGGQHRLADIRAGPLQHDRPCGHQYSMPS